MKSGNTKGRHGVDWPALTMVLGEGSCPHRVCLAVVYPLADDARVLVAGRVGLLAAMPEGLQAAMRGAA